MVRPRASLETLHFAGAFAEAVTAKLDPRTAKTGSKVECRGANSVFAALSICHPHLVRNGNEPAKKGAVSEIQLLKYLAQIGFIPFRHRKRILGTTDKWSNGCRQWKNLRWVQVDKPEELERLKARLDEIGTRFPKKSKFQQEKLFAFLSSVISLSDSRGRGKIQASSETSSSDSASQPLQPIPRRHLRTSNRLDNNGCMQHIYSPVRGAISPRARPG